MFNNSIQIWICLFGDLVYFEEMMFLSFSTIILVVCE
jgi:hypothetical protein